MMSVPWTDLIIIPAVVWFGEQSRDASEKHNSSKGMGKKAISPLLCESKSNCISKWLAWISLAKTGPTPGDVMKCTCGAVTSRNQSVMSEVVTVQRLQSVLIYPTIAEPFRSNWRLKS